jgi:hypothetical protein
VAHVTETRPPRDSFCPILSGGLPKIVTIQGRRGARQIETSSRKKSRLLYYKQFSRILIFWHADCIKQPVGL